MVTGGNETEKWCPGGHYQYFCRMCGGEHLREAAYELCQKCFNLEVATDGAQDRG